jgi:hypothetical protein
MAMSTSDRSRTKPFLEDIFKRYDGTLTWLSQIKLLLFFQSVVLLSRLPFVSLFHKVTHRVANEYFDKGVTSIEAACQDIDQWPAPVPGEQINLSLIGELMQVIANFKFF